MYNLQNLSVKKFENIKMLLECKKFDNQGEIKSTERIITNLDLKNKYKVFERDN